MRRLRVLAIGAHPDDLEICCAGTLARFASRGDGVAMAFLCSGNRGAVGVRPEDLASIRSREAQAAAQLIQADLLPGGFRADLSLFHDEPTRVLVTDLIRRAQPDLILTHGDQDYNPDHLTTHELVMAAIQVASIPAYVTEQPAIPRRVPVLVFEPLGSVGFVPTDYVDVSDTFATKLAMWQCHESQVKFMEGHRKSPVTHIIQITAAFRGLQCGVQYAEAFRRHEVYGGLLTERLLP